MVSAKLSAKRFLCALASVCETFCFITVGWRWNDYMRGVSLQLVLTSSNLRLSLGYLLASVLRIK